MEDYTLSLPSYSIGENVYQKIGEILLSAGKINLIHLSMALDAQRFQKMPLGVMFILFKVITKDDLEQALLAQRYIDDRIASGAV